MVKYQYLIIGGGVAGTTAAETIRQKDPTGTIAIVSDETHPLYSRVMLSKPNFFLGQIPLEQIWLKNQNAYKQNRIDFLNEKSATDLDPKNKVVGLAGGEKIGYEKLLLATGVRARPLLVSGAEKKGVHYLRTLEDGQAIMADLKEAKIAVVLGGSFIGFEMADLLRLAGLSTTLLLHGPHFWSPVLDEPAGLMIEKAITQAGIKIFRQTEITEILGEEKVRAIKLKSGQELPCEMLVCGIGIINNLDWLKTSGLNTARGIIANEYLETNLPNVWTAGDIAEYQDLILGERVQLGNWVNAHEQGKFAGLNMTGQRQSFQFVSFYTTQGFGLGIAFVGNVAPSADRIIIPRGSPEINSYARLIIAGKELVGATLINRTVEMSIIAKLIEKNIDVSSRLAELADPNFDLKKLLV